MLGDKPRHLMIARAVILSVAVALTASGCGDTAKKSGSETSKAHASVQGSAHSSQSKVPKFAGIQHPLPSGAALSNAPDMYKYVLQKGCGPVAGGWEARGTAKNASASPLPFKILVFFTDQQARIVDSASTTVTIAAHATGDWTAKRQFKAPKGGARCVVRAVTKG